MEIIVKKFFMNTQMGIGINDTTKLEGIKENNFWNICYRTIINPKSIIYGKIA